MERADALPSDATAPSETDSDLSGGMSYGDYLDLDRVLAAQHPKTAAHDEMLFIVQHQAAELWMKLTIHELLAARRLIDSDDFRPAFKTLARVGQITRLQIEAWDVLATMTPNEFLAFRDDLGMSSGFQSYQYRMIEFLLGNRSARLLKPHQHRPDLQTPLVAAMAEPSLYDAAIGALVRAGFSIDPAATSGRDRTQPHAPHPSIQTAWQAVYQDPKRHWELYELAEELIDVEDQFRHWRFRHLTTVERIIGAKIGTGGSSGVGYLRAMLDVVLFPELWQVRAAL